MVRLGLNVWEIPKVTDALGQGAEPADLAKAFNTTEEVIRGFSPEKVDAAEKARLEREGLSTKKTKAVKAAADVAAATVAKLAQDSFE